MRKPRRRDSLPGLKVRLGIAAEDILAPSLALLEDAVDRLDDANKRLREELVYATVSARDNAEKIGALELRIVSLEAVDRITGTRVVVSHPADDAARARRSAPHRKTNGDAISSD